MLILENLNKYIEKTSHRQEKTLAKDKSDKDCYPNMQRSFKTQQ